MMRTIGTCLTVVMTSATHAQEARSFSPPTPSTELESCLMELGVMTFTGLSLAADYGTIDPVLRAMSDELYSHYRERCTVIVTLAFPESGGASEWDLAAYSKWQRVGHCTLALGTSVPNGQRLAELLEIGPSTIEAWCQGFESTPLPPLPRTSAD